MRISVFHQMVGLSYLRRIMGTRTFLSDDGRGLYPPPVIPAGIRRNPVEYNLAGSSAKLPFRGQ